MLASAATFEAAQVVDGNLGDFRFFFFFWGGGGLGSLDASTIQVATTALFDAALGLLLLTFRNMIKLSPQTITHRLER